MYKSMTLSIDSSQHWTLLSRGDVMGNLQVMVIGAGTGGPALAHGLRAAGIAVRVFERDHKLTDRVQVDDQCEGRPRIAIVPTEVELRAVHRGLGQGQHGRLFF